MLKSQLLIPSDTKRFSLSSMLTANGYRNHTNQHFTRLRRWLEDHGYIRHSIKGREEYWINEAHLTDEDRAHIASLNESRAIFTTDQFAKVNFPGLPRPLSLSDEMTVERAIRAAGFVLRGLPPNQYWSAKFKRRDPAPQYDRVQAASRLPKPRYIRYPPRGFNLIEFLHVNRIPRSPEAFIWARKHCDTHCKKFGTSYVRPNARGAVPAAFTGGWSVPSTSPNAFTTAQFQTWNNARRVSAQEWASAVRWLEDNGYGYEPREKRWIKSYETQSED
jgi:hypothetical protein